MGHILIIKVNDNENQLLENIITYIEKQNESVLYNNSQEKLIHGDLVIDTLFRQVRIDKTEIRLTNYEFEILYLLASNPGRVYSKEQIYNLIWKSPYLGAEDNVTSLIGRIRKKIELDPKKPQYIITVWGRGYKFNRYYKKYEE